MVKITGVKWKWRVHEDEAEYNMQEHIYRNKYMLLW